MSLAVDRHRGRHRRPVPAGPPAALPAAADRAGRRAGVRAGPGGHRGRGRAARPHHRGDHRARADDHVDDDALQRRRGAGGGAAGRHAGAAARHPGAAVRADPRPGGGHLRGGRARLRRVLAGRLGADRHPGAAQEHPLLFATGLLLTVLAMASWGSVLAPLYLLARSARTFQNSLSFPLYLLGGVLVQIDLYPAWVHRSAGWSSSPGARRCCGTAPGCGTRPPGPCRCWWSPGWPASPSAAG